ncbi:unnamed protein product [Effrenium voratum]|nr:unnamed protein product [Effrenium voratum]
MAGYKEETAKPCCECKAEDTCTFASPLEAMKGAAKEKLMYIPAVNIEDTKTKPDYMATVDVDPESPSYCQVIHRLYMPVVGDELHHVGWNACASCVGQKGRPTHAYLVSPGVISGNIYFIDVKSDPKVPKFHKVIEGKDLLEKFGVAFPHTAHCAPEEIIMSFMGGKTKEGKYIPGGAGFVTFDPVTLEMKRRWEVGKQIDFNYDFWYQPRRNVMVSSEWGDPECFTNGFNPAHVADGRYGRKLYVWNWTERTLIKELDLGVGAIPLEVRFLHNPDKAEGYVGNALSSEMVRFVEREGDWVSEIAIKVEPIEVEGWALPAMPSLITDFCISLDDKYLYFSNWLHGDVRQYDISVVKGVEIQGGSGAFFGIWTHGAMGVKINHAAQMVQLSLDGKRLYVSTSLFSSWDRQFYPDMLKRGAQLLQLDVDTEKGGLTVNPEFLVDFGQDGPVSCHEMRFPGGDSTSATEEMQFLLPHSRREAVTELPIPVEKFRSVVEMDRMAENSVFLATKPRGRDTRLKLDTLKRSESRLTGRRRAVQADASGPNDQRGEGIDRPQENKLGFYLRSPEETSEATNIFTQCDADGDGSMNLDEFQTFVQKVRAKLLTLRRREEVLIAKKFDLEPELMHEFRASLPFLWKVFERYSFNKPEQGVRREDLLPFMVDAGVAPPNTEDPQSLPLMDIIKEFARPLSKFPAVLEIVQKGRLALRASLEEDLTASFRYYDRDGSGQLSKQEIYGILEEFGMLPRTKAEQQEVGQVVEQLDRDGSGSFDLLEFHDFFQMMMEQVRLAERKREGELALSLGFSEERCAYLRRTWMSLKPRVDGTVPQMNLAQSMGHLLRLMDVTPDEPLRVYMRSVQQAPDTPIDFVTFLTTVKTVLLDNQEEVLDDDRQVKRRKAAGSAETRRSHQPCQHQGRVTLMGSCNRSPS